MQRPITVLANDYLSSIPTSGIKVRSGPLRFSLGIKNYLTKNGVRWVGVIGQAKQPKETLAHRDASGTWEIHRVGVSHARLETIRESAPRSLAGARRWASEDMERIGQIFDEVRPDALFLNGYSSYAWMLFDVATRRGVPVVIQHAGVFSIEVRQYRELFGEPGRRLCYAMERATATGATSNIFLNKFSARSFARALRLRTPIRGEAVVPLPHAGWKFQHGPFGPAQGQKERTVGVVARWDRIKNLEGILAFAEEVARRNLPWKIKVVTKIPKTPIKAEFKKRFRELIEVIPQMGPDEIRKFYQGCDVMLLPSRFETLGAVVMEALSVGVPTAVSATTGWIDTYKENGMTDWVLDFSRPRKAVLSVERHLARKSWPEVENLSRHVQKNNDPKKVFETYLKIIRRAAKKYPAAVTKK